MTVKHVIKSNQFDEVTPFVFHSPITCFTCHQSKGGHNVNHARDLGGTIGLPEQSVESGLDLFDEITKCCTFYTLYI